MNKDRRNRLNALIEEIETQVSEFESAINRATE